MLKRREQLWHLGINGKIILKIILRKCGLRVLSGLYRLRMGNNGWLGWTWSWTTGKVWAIVGLSRGYVACSHVVSATACWNCLFAPQFGGSEAIITALSDEYPIIGKNREIFVACLFTLYFLVGLASCAQVTNRQSRDTIDTHGYVRHTRYGSTDATYNINNIKLIFIITNTMHTIGVDKILSTPIVCIVLVIINIFIILHGHTTKRKTEPI